MMWSRHGGFGSRRFWAWFSVLALLLSLFCALPSESWAASEETSPLSEPDWPELTRYLDEIDSGLQMTDSPLNLIESSLAEREQNLSERQAALAEKEQQLNETDLRLQRREQGLNERESDLDKRESLYADMRKARDDAEKKLKQGIVWLLLAFLTGGACGWLAGR